VDSFFFRARVVGARLINDNIIFVENDFEIHEFVEGGFYQRLAKKPAFPKVVSSNFNIQHSHDVIKVMINQPIGFISIEYDVDGLINNYDDRKVAGKHKIDFLVVRG
jgi:hypothetical protein